MALLRRTDVSPASWISSSEIAWRQLATFGPSVFAVYARLLFLRDPAYPGETSSDAGRTATRDGREQWPLLAERLAAHTRAADDCYFCLWDGWPTLRGGSVGTLLSGAQVKISDDAGHPMRAYLLFHGPLSEIGEWDVPWLDTGEPFGFEPAFIWPADHAWCVTKDVDPHWAGIGGDRPLIDELLQDPRLDVVKADPTADQPHYYR
ncbi:MAG TPA: hypothetical protein VGG07_13345 [Solirubrobacteraceae bacterium]